MESFDKRIQEFLQTICNQIRYKSIHKSIVNELSDHIYEQKDEFVRQGLDEETATVKAIEEMGDPVSVGRQLDNTHRPRTEWSILILAASLVVIGGMVQYFLSGAAENNSEMFSSFLAYCPVGIAAFMVAYFFDYTLLGRYSKLAFFVLSAATVAGFFIFDTRFGAYRHVYYSALLFIPAFAGIIYGFRGKGYPGIIASGLFYGLSAIFCIIAPTFSGLWMLTLSCLIILTVAIMKDFFGGSKKLSLAIVYVPTAAAMLVFLLTLAPYQMHRLTAMLNPYADQRGSGWQVLIVRRIINSSKLFGNAVLEGDLANMRIEQFLPGWSNDLSLTYIIGRLGFAAGIVIIALLFILVVRMFSSVIKQKNAYGYLVSLAACIAITGQIVTYVLCNFGVLMLGGTLPFISFGGMSFVVNMTLLGLLLSVHRRMDIVKDRLPKDIENRRWVILENGKLIIDLGINSDKGMGR